MHFNTPLSFCHSDVSTWIQSTLDMCWIWMNMFFKHKWRIEFNAVKKLVLCSVAVLHFPDRWIQRLQLCCWVSTFFFFSWLTETPRTPQPPPPTHTHTVNFSILSFPLPLLTPHPSQLVLIVRLCNWGNAVNDVWVVSLFPLTHLHTHKHWWWQIGLFHLSWHGKDKAYGHRRPRCGGAGGLNTN